MFRKSLLAVSLTAVFFASAIFPAWSQPPIAVAPLLAAAEHDRQQAVAIKIIGPNSAPVGSAVILKLEGVKLGDTFDFFIAPSAGQCFVLFDKDGSPFAVITIDAAGVYTGIAVRYDAESKSIVRSVHSVTIGPVKPPPGPGPDPGPDPPPPVDPDNKALAATFVYEKDEHVVPAAVLSGLNKLNRERKIIATLLDDDTTDGGGNIPEQYKLIVPAARAAGLPALVVTGAKGVIRVVKSPTTEAQVLEAAP